MGQIARIGNSGVKSLEWLLLIGLFPLLAYGIYQTNIYILLHYERCGTNDNVFIRVYAWRGFLSYVAKVPVVEVDWKDEMLWLESELKETKGNARIQTVFERHVIKKVVDFICHHPKRFQRLIGRMQKKIQQARIIIRELHAKIACDKLNCHIQFGMEDAAAVGMAAGGLWLLRGLVIAAMRSRMSFGACPACTITPVFGKDCLSVQLECILRIRLGNLINALYNADKRGGTNRG